MKKLLLPALLAATFAMPALANDATDEFFAEWDLNQDGEVTQLEARTRLTQVFGTFDTNMDGYLDADDTNANDDDTAPNGEGGEAIVGFGDENGDERVSLLEFIDKSGLWIDMMDRNNDGVVTVDDFTVVAVEG